MGTFGIKPSLNEASSWRKPKWMTEGFPVYFRISLGPPDVKVCTLGIWVNCEWYHHQHKVFIMTPSVRHKVFIMTPSVMHIYYIKGRGN